MFLSSIQSLFPKLIRTIVFHSFPTFLQKTSLLYPLLPNEAALCFPKANSKRSRLDQDLKGIIVDTLSQLIKTGANIGQQQNKLIAKHMKSEFQFRLNKIAPLEKQDILKQHYLDNLRRRKAAKRKVDLSPTLDNGFSHLTFFKLNKGVTVVLTQKKHLMQQEKNTEIERSNRLLHEKLTIYAPRSLTHVKKRFMSIEKKISPEKSKKKQKRSNGNQTLPVLKRKFDSEREVLTKNNEKQAMTLFIGSSKIDGLDMKIKIAISDGIYYLIAQNEQAKIVLQMPEEQYWALHYKQFEENPCNIFKYLKVQNGEINFKVMHGSERGLSGSKKSRACFSDKLPSI